jgi:hypothetical protein
MFVAQVAKAQRKPAASLPDRLVSQGSRSVARRSAERGSGLERKAALATNFGVAPPVVSEVLRFSGLVGGISRVPQSFQGLKIGAPGDVYEREADRTAAILPPASSWNGPGHDFSNLRIHTGARAAESARALDAKAYTMGNNIVFGEGQYAPGTPAGDRLLAHELTHVIQQSGGERLLQRAETDTSKGCSTLADTKSDINTVVNAALARARGSSATPAAANVIEGVFQSLGVNTSLGRTAIEDWAGRLGPGKVDQPAQSTTKYAGVSYRLWAQKTFPILNPTMRVNDICVGSDKLGHFFQQGHEYFEEAHRSGKGPADAEKMGRETEAGGFGLAATGVFSNADLEANRQGLKFYEDLNATPSMTFDIAKYINVNWNEEFKPSLYEESKVAPQVWSNILAGVWEGTFTEPGNPTPVPSQVILGMKGTDEVAGATFTTRPTGTEGGAITNGKVTRQTVGTGATAFTSFKSAVSGVQIDFDWTMLRTAPVVSASGKGFWKSVKENELKGRWGTGNSKDNGGDWDLFKKGVSGTGTAAPAAAPAPAPSAPAPAP